MPLNQPLGGNPRYLFTDKTTAGAGVIDAPESFDIYVASIVRERALSLQSEAVSGIIFNMEKVEFLDQSALGVIIGTLHRMHGKGRWAAVAGASGKVRKIFTVTGLDGIVPCYATVGEAAAREPGRRLAQAEDAAGA